MGNQSGSNKNSTENKQLTLEEEAARENAWHDHEDDKKIFRLVLEESHNKNQLMFFGNPKSSQRAFREFKVEVKNDLQEEDVANESQKKIQIILTERIEPTRLPYFNEVKQYIRDYNGDPIITASVTRLNQCMVLARGEAISPEELFEIGGFHPAASATGLYATTEKLLNFLDHRLGVEYPYGTGFTSFTSSITVAKHFAGPQQHVYLAKTTGPVTPIRDAEHGKDHFGEDEYSVPGGVDAVDVIAYRKLDKDNSFYRGHDFHGSSIFIKEEFIQQYPYAVGDIIAFYLQPNERYCTPSTTYVSEPGEELDDDHMAQSHFGQQSDTAKKLKS